MKKRLMSILAVIFLLVTTNLASAEMDDVQQGKVKIYLNVQVLTTLYIQEGYELVRIIPGPEDYIVETIYEVGFDPLGNPMPIPIRVNGFADRAEAIKLQIFTNAKSGAKLYVYGEQPPGPQGILRLEDTYLTVMTEKTYILLNCLEVPLPTGVCTRSGPGGWPYACTDYLAGPPTPTDILGAYWLRLHNEAQTIFEVNQATKAERLIVFKLGIADLARYTAGVYSNTITFVLMPQV